MTQVAENATAGANTGGGDTDARELSALLTDGDTARLLKCSKRQGHPADVATPPAMLAQAGDDANQPSGAEEQADKLPPSRVKAYAAGEEHPEPHKRCVKWRDLCSASVAASVVFCLFEAIVYGIPWNWLRDHPATCGIQVTVGSFILVAMLGWFVRPWRKYAWWRPLLIALGLLILSRL